VSPEQEQNIDVIVVVSGQPEHIRVNVHQKLEQLVREALNESGNEGQALSDWELRLEDGSLLDQDLRVQDAGVTAGMTLFLSPKAGAGGEA
jgi:hypothetical protein